MKKLFNDQGFTLTEVLVSLAILMIISIAFLTLFTSSYSSITKSGFKNKQLYELQTEVEQTIDSKTTSGGEVLNISFPGISNSIKVNGSVETKEIILDKNKISISVFIPNSSK